MRTRIIFLVCFMSLIAVLPVTAQTGSDNWCYTGGPLEGQCGNADTAESRWMWYYGFYRAQIAKGLLSRDDLPAEYRVGFGIATSNSTSTSSATVTTTSTTSSSSTSYSESEEFNAWIAYCEYDEDEDETKVFLGWRDLDYTGDEIKVSLPDEGSETDNKTIPKETDEFRVTFDDVFYRIKDGGKVKIYRDDVLIGEHSLNSINECEVD